VRACYKLKSRCQLNGFHLLSGRLYLNANTLAQAVNVLHPQDAIVELNYSVTIRGNRDFAVWNGDHRHIGRAFDCDEDVALVQCDGINRRACVFRRRSGTHQYPFGRAFQLVFPGKLAIRYLLNSGKRPKSRNAQLHIRRRYIRRHKYRHFRIEWIVGGG